MTATTASLTDDERKVLRAYQQACAQDPEGAFGPAYPAIGGSLEDIELVLATCKVLKKRKLLDGEVGRGRASILTTSLWITASGEDALRKEKNRDGN